MDFTLERQRVLLANFNARAELNGEERVPAADLKFEMSASNDILAEFDPALKSSLFRRPNSDDKQAELLDATPGWAPLPRFPRMGGFTWDDKTPLSILTIHLPRGEVRLAECLADSFKIEPAEGGQVTVSFRVRCKPDERQAGKLYTLTQQHVDVTLEPMPEAAPSAIPDAQAPQL